METEMIMNEKKTEKMCELGNLIAQYNAGERENLNANEYPQWVMIYDMLKSAEIDDEIFDEFISEPEKYKVVNGKIVYNSNWQADANKKEEERIANLHITKRDFFYAFCKPVGITVAQLEAKIEELGMESDWKYCNHVYYGVIKQFLTALPLQKTEAQIIAIFEELCTK